MKSHKRKMIAPIVVTVLFLVYFGLYFGVIVYLLPGILKYLFGILPLSFFAVMIYVCIQRIQEIKKGEEDDLSQY